MKEKIKNVWYWLAFIITIIVAYTIFIICTCLALEFARKFVEYFFN